MFMIQLNFVSYTKCLPVDLIQHTINALVLPTLVYRSLFQGMNEAYRKGGHTAAMQRTWQVKLACRPRAESLGDE